MHAPKQFICANLEQEDAMQQTSTSTACLPKAFNGLEGFQHEAFGAPPSARAIAAANSNSPKTPI